MGMRQLRVRGVCLRSVSAWTGAHIRCKLTPSHISIFSKHSNPLPPFALKPIPLKPMPLKPMPCSLPCRYVCLYDVQERVMLRRFQVSHNRSLDGVLDMLSSRNMTGEAAGEVEPFRQCLLLLLPVDAVCCMKCAGVALALAALVGVLC